jgi:hypothetical protein
VTVVAIFYHFILVQTLAIVLALICMAYPSDGTSAVGFLSFAYAILVGIATAGQLLGTAQIFSASGSLPDPDGGLPSPQKRRPRKQSRIETLPERQAVWSIFLTVLLEKSNFRISCQNSGSPRPA